MTTFKIHPIVVGTKVFDKSMMTYQHGTGQELTIPIFVWYLEGGDQTILVDTGLMGVIQSEAREQAIGGKIYTFEEGLARWGLTPEDVDLVVHTHLHNDHCENDAKCVNATFYAHELELAAAYDPHPLDYRYMAEFIEEQDDADRIVKLTGDQEIVEGLRVVHTPAHTAGGMTVLVDTAKGTAAITGFCVVRENLEPPLSVQALDLEVIPPGTHVNAYDAYNQVLRVKSMADILLPLHEPDLAAVDTIPAEDSTDEP